MYDIQIAGLTEKEANQIADIFSGKEIEDVSECQTDLVAVSADLIILNLSAVDKDLGISERFDFDCEDYSKYAVIENLISQYSVNLFNDFKEALNAFNF